MRNVLHADRKQSFYVSLLIVAASLLLACTRNSGERITSESQAPQHTKFTSCVWSDSAVVAQIETENGDRIVRLAWKPGGLRGIATIADMNNTILVTITERFIEADSSLTTCEQTSTDVFCVKQHFNTDTQKQTETFTQNGQSLTVTYPAASQQAMDAGYESYIAGHFQELDPQYMAALQSFEAFYDPNTSLSNNDDGEALVLAIYDLAAQSRPAGAAFRSVPGPQELSAARQVVDWFCAFVSIVTTLKCEFGGPFNLVCLAGTTVSLACAFFYIFTSGE